MKLKDLLWFKYTFKHWKLIRIIKLKLPNLFAQKIIKFLQAIKNALLAQNKIKNAYVQFLARFEKFVALSQF